MTETQSKEYTQRARDAGAKEDATGFVFGNIYDSAQGKMILNDEEIAKVREVAKDFLHSEMGEKAKRVRLLNDMAKAIGQDKLRRVGIAILVEGTAKYAWPEPQKEKAKEECSLFRAALSGVRKQPWGLRADPEKTRANSLILW